MPAAPRDAAPAPAPSPAPRPAGGPVDADSLRRDWESVLEAVMRVRRVAWMLLRNATVESLADGILTVRFAREGDVKGFASSGCDADLKRVLAASFGLNVQIRSLSGAAPAVRPDREGGAGSAPGAQEISSRTVPPQPRAEVPEPSGEGQPRPAESAPVPAGPPPEDGDPFDAEDPDASAGDAALTGIDLIKRELGGQIVAETDNG
jgi:DNA polymerase-3 subunit gamma/tau